MVSVCEKFVWHHGFKSYFNNIFAHLSVSECALKVTPLHRSFQSTFFVNTVDTRYYLRVKITYGRFNVFDEDREIIP